MPLPNNDKRENLWKVKLRADLWATMYLSFFHPTQWVDNCDKSYRSSHQSCSVKKSVLRNFKKFTGKHLCQSLFFNNVAGLRPATLLKKRLWHRCFPVNFVKFLRTPFLTEYLWLLLMEIKDLWGKSHVHSENFCWRVFSLLDSGVLDMIFTKVHVTKWRIFSWFLLFLVAELMWENLNN